MTELIQEKSDDIQQIPQWLPVVPLNNAILFPGAAAPIAVSSDEASRAIEMAAKSNRLFAAIALKSENKKKNKRFDHFYRIGTAAMILRMMRGSEETTQLVARGTHKIKVLAFREREGIPWAKVEIVEEKKVSSKEIDALTRQVAQMAETLIQRAPLIPDELQGLPSSMQNPHRLAYMVLSLTRSDIHLLQEIYETLDLAAKLRMTLKEVSHELELINIGGKIQDEIQSKISKTERDYYLREQLQAIRKELGESEDEKVEIDEIRKKIEKKALPDAVREKSESELKRLDRMSPNSPEYPMTRNYLEWLIEFPWEDSTTDKLNIRRAEKILHDDHFDLKNVKDRILEYLAVRKLNPDIKGPILCFVGPPGVGKTSLGQSIAKALDRRFVRLSLGGVHDEAEIRGHRRTYIGALPGTIVQHIRRAGKNNPVFMLDEIDKVGSNFRGDPSSALLEVLDPEQNHTFRDHYMELDIDLSKVLFIATANTPDRIQPALRDRMEEIRLAGYTTYEKEEIAKQYLVPRAAKENGLSESDVSFGKGAMDFLIRNYTREAGVRNLEREIHAICRKIAVQKTKGRLKKRKITKERIIEFLGPQRFFEEVKRRTSKPGVATGLAWTPVGGEILFIEALPVNGSKGILLTGKLGEVMKESAKAAVSLIRSRTDQLNIDHEFFNKNEIHLHIPAGAVAKDGPSAGIAIATSVASAAMNIPIRNDLAMTGELTLSGQVLPVGGIKEKILAAHRAGIQHIILPTRNKKDLDEVDKTIIKDLKFTYVDTIDHVLNESILNKKRTAPKSRNAKSNAKNN